MLLASLYLPWQTSSCSDDFFGGQGGTTCGLLHVFGGSGTNEGLSSEVGRAAALFALLLVVLAAVAWARPNLVRRLPLGTCALLASYFGAAVGVLARSTTQEGFDVHFASGAYVGLAAIVLVLVAASVARRTEIPRYYRSASRLTMLVLAGGLLATFLLPWWQLEVPTDMTWVGLTSPVAVVAAALALCLPGIWSRSDPAGFERLALAAAIALFTGGAASSQAFLGHRAYGAGLALTVAGALLVLALVNGSRRFRVEEASWQNLITGAAAALFLATLFLPWQRWCYAADEAVGSSSGGCFSTNAWATTGEAAASAAVLAIALAVAALRTHRLRFSTVELAVGFGILIATTGFFLEEAGGGGVRVEHAYGSTIGFILAGALVVLALLGSRLTTFSRQRFLVRLAPLAACAGYVAIVVLPWWHILPDDPFWAPSLGFAPFSWLTIAGALVGIHLLGLWARQIAGASPSAELVLLPLALLALAAVDLIAQRERGLTWVGGAVIGLCLLLAALGRMEQRGGLESFRIPEALRLDRL